MLNLLLAGLGGNVSQGILKAARLSGIPLKIVGACVSPTSAGLYFCDKAILSPYAADPEFIPWIEKTCAAEEVDLLLSGVEEVLERLSPCRKRLLDKYGTRVVVSDPEKLAIGRDKLATARWLKNNAFPYPDYCLSEEAGSVQALAEKHNYKLIAKPRYGKGSQGLVRIDSPGGLSRLDGLENYVVQEEVGDAENEFTVACYRTLAGVTHTVVMRRKLTAGTTSFAEIVDNPPLADMASDICKKFSPTGPLNLQFRLGAGSEPVCFEMNVRFSGTAPMRAHFGFEDVKAAIMEYGTREMPTACFQPRPGVAMRYWNEIYVDKSAVLKLGASGFLDDPAARTDAPAPLSK